VKRFLFCLVFVACMAVLAMAEAPQKPECVGIGTRSEGWLIVGEPIRYAQCAGKSAECGAVGTRSEGWYAFEKVPGGRLEYARCAGSAELPRCVAQGTRSEGWLIPGQKIRYAKCAGIEVECAAIGTRSEGWYLYVKNPAGLIQYAECSEPQDND
jgi:hypothetical protein